MANTFVTVCACLLLALSGCQASEDDITESEWSGSLAENDNNQNLKEEQASDVLLLNSISQSASNTPTCLLWKQLGALEERLNVTVRTLEEKLDASEKKLAALNSIVTQGQQRVAFSAKRAVTEGNIAAGQADLSLVYIHVMSNIGNAYNPHTGFFIAPVDGMYFFSFTSYFWPAEGITAGSLFHNGHRVVSWHGYSKEQPLSQSNSAVLLLRQGDAVNVRVWAGYIIGDNLNNYCSFSGFLLFPM